MRWVYDWSAQVIPGERHMCNCDYCEVVDFEDDVWPVLVSVKLGSTEYITDRYMMIRADLAPVPETYPGIVATPTLTDLPKFMRTPVTATPATGLRFRPQILAMIADSPGWQLRIMGHPDSHPGIARQMVAIVAGDGETVGWTRSASVWAEYTEADA